MFYEEEGLEVKSILIFSLLAWILEIYLTLSDLQE